MVLAAAVESLSQGLHHTQIIHSIQKCVLVLLLLFCFASNRVDVKEGAAPFVFLLEMEMVFGGVTGGWFAITMAAVAFIVSYIYYWGTAKKRQFAVDSKVPTRPPPYASLAV